MIRAVSVQNAAHIRHLCPHTGSCRLLLPAKSWRQCRYLLTLVNSRRLLQFSKFLFCHLCFLQAQHWPELDLEWLKSARECLMLNMAHTFTVKSINNFINVVQKSFGVTIPYTWHLHWMNRHRCPLAKARACPVSAASVVNILIIISARPQRQQMLYLIRLG